MPPRPARLALIWLAACAHATPVAHGPTTTVRAEIEQAVETGQVGPFQELGQHVSHIFKRRCLFYVVVVNTVNKAGFQRDGNGRVNPPGLDDQFTIGHGFGNANFHDPVVHQVHPGRF